MNLYRKLPLALAVSVLSTGGAGVAWAQGPSAGGLEEVVVTARKREESVQDVPVHVTAFSAEQIRRKDLTSLEKLAATTPNFNVGRTSNGSGARLTMRGIGSTPSSIGIEQSVAVIVDNVYYGQGRVINEGFFDLQAVEVLKGPQALFFGKNATAGAVSLTTANPGDEFEAKIRGSYEFEAETAQIEGMVSTPITDNLGIRVALRATDMSEGYYDNEMYDFNYPRFDIATGNLNIYQPDAFSKKQPQEEELLGRVTLQWMPTDDLTATVKYTHDENEMYNSSWNYSCIASATGNSTLNGYPCNGGFTTHQANFPAEIAANFPGANEGPQLYNDYESDSITLNLGWELDNMTWSWVSNWQENDNSWACNCDFEANPATVFATEESTWTAWSTELRMLTTLDGPFNFMLGGYYQETKRDFDQWIAFGGVEDSSQSPERRYVATSKDSETEGETMALFGQVIWTISDTIEATAGARYIDETKDSYFLQPYNNAALTFIFRPAEDPLGVVNAKQDFDNLSPEVTVRWTPEDDLMFYAAYKTGYKSGGFSNSGINSGFSQDPAGDLTFAEEEAEGFEVGVKSTIMDNQLRLNATAYMYDFTDLQIDFFRSDIFAFNTVTADAATSGIELEFQYAPTSISGLELHGSINYNKSEYDDSTLPCYNGQTPAQGCNLAPNAAGAFTRQDVDGVETAVAPEWTGLIGGSFEFAVGAGLTMILSADARYSDEYIGSGFGQPFNKQDSYWYADASARLLNDEGNWEVAVIAKNLTDEFYISNGQDGPSTGTGTGTPQGVMADQMGLGNIPFTIALEASYWF